jgi:DNA-binding SARP family transcriptional activator
MTEENAVHEKQNGGSEPSPLQYRLLGGLAVTSGGRELDLATPKQRAVLAVLLLERDRVVSVDRLIELLWGESADKPLSSLQAYVSRLRSLLEPDRRPRDPATVLISQSPGYRLAAPRGDVDLYRFEDTVAAGLEQLRGGNHAAAAATLDAGLRLWTGALLPEFGGEPFVIAAAERAEGVRLAALEAAAEARLMLGDHPAAVVLLDHEAADHPGRERLQELLALALYRSGRQADALRVVDRCRRALAASSGLDPGPDLRRLETEMLAQSPALDWRATAASAASSTTAVSTTTAAAPVKPDDLIGRADEFGVLADALDAARAGRGGVGIIIGEPGIGKTRLAEALTELATARGLTSAWARCPESRAAPPFWAVTRLGDQLQEAGVLDLPGSASDAFVGDAEVQERFGLYRAVIDTVARLDRPVLLIIDDLQWADPDSLRLLEHVAADVASTRALLVATVRPLAEDAPEALVDCLAEVARVSGGFQIPLAGLPVEEVATWLSSDIDRTVPDEVIAVVHDRTGGNPLFIKELTALLAAEGRLDDAVSARAARTIPPGVQFVVRRRVSRLPRPSQQALTVAAVIGPLVDPRSIADATSTDVGAVLEALAPALDAGLLVESDGELRFSHALVADALASEVNAVRQASIHAAVARSLAARAPDGFGLAAAAIAHHASEGILAGTGDLAIDAGSAAARLAESRYADEDAAVHWGDVANALARARPSDVAGRVDALIRQARALVRVDRVSAAKEPILAAVELASSVGMTDAMVEAASLINLTHVWTNEGYGVVDDRIVGALELTLAAAEHDDATRAILLGALASELVFGDRQRHVSVCAAAETAARASGDPDVLARVLNNITAPMRPDQLEQRRAQALEIIELVERHGLSADLAFVGQHHLAGLSLESADLPAFEAAIERAARAREGVAGPRLLAQQLWIEATLAVMTGRYEDAAALGERSHELHRLGRHYDAAVLYLAGIAAVAIDRGGLEDMIPFMMETADESAYGRTTAESMAFGMLEFGRADLATKLVARFGPDDPIPSDWSTLFCLNAGLHVRVELGDRVGADSLAAQLAPYSERWTNAGTSPISIGPAAMSLARYAAMCGDDGAARRLFERSVAICEAMRAPAWLARSLTFQGQYLVEVGDAAVGAAALDRARELARRHQLPYVQRRLGGAPPSP